jgi:CDP-glucose 4,6-dehydratase
VLVTGATGMVGASLCAELVSQGVPVVALVRDDDPSSELHRSGCWRDLRVVNGRLEDLATIERAITVHDVGTVFHLGAQTLVGAARRDPVGTFEANIRGTWNVLEVARRQWDLVSRVIVASSDKAYGTSEVLPYTEDHPLDGIQPYEVSKSCADLLARSYAMTYDVPVRVARCGNIYGPGDLNWSRLVPGTIRSLLLDQRPVIRSNGKLVRDYLYVGDAVGAYLALADADAPQLAYNFSDSDPKTVTELYDAICAAVGKPGTEALVLGEAADEIPAQHLDASRARRDLGWEVGCSLEEGLGRTVQWYRDLLATDPNRF